MEIGPVTAIVSCRCPWDSDWMRTRTAVIRSLMRVGEFASARSAYFADGGVFGKASTLSMSPE
jgi:hypothetical protein